MSKKEGQKGYKITKNGLSVSRKESVISAYLENDAKTFIRKMQNRHILPEEYGPILKKYLEDQENDIIDPEANGIGQFKLKTTEFED